MMSKIRLKNDPPRSNQSNFLSSKRKQTNNDNNDVRRIYKTEDDGKVSNFIILITESEDIV